MKPVLDSLRSSILLILCLCTVTTAQARGLNAWDVSRIQYVSSVVVSPDDVHVAYTLTVPREVLAEENGPAYRELHLYDLEHESSTPFVVGDVNVGHVSFTRDGRHIGYLAKRDGDDHTSLYVIAVDGGESRRLLSWPETISSYAFGPEGRRVAFLAREPRDEDRQALKKKGFDMEVYEEDWRPSHLYVVDIDLDATDAAKDEPRRIDVEGHLADLQWAPSGDHVLVSVAPTSLIDDRYMERQFAVIDVEKGGFVGRIETRGKLGAAAMSPDGSAVAFIGPVDFHDPAAGRLMVAPASGGAPRTLLGRDFEGHVRSVRWMDDKNLLFLADRGTHTFVGSIAAKGGKVRELVSGDRPVVTSIDLSADGRVLAGVGESASHPGELFAGRVGRPFEQLTHSNPWLADRELAQQSVVEWQARDGLRIEGILIEPLRRTKGQHHPLIVSVHGGPESHDRDGWKTSYSRLGQVAAAEGFAVLYPNYRGSTGRGVEFSLLSQGDPGGSEFEDIVDGVDALAERGLIDPERVGITGGSYGGYATAWGATYYTDRYAAAVMFVGISEQVSKYGTTDIPNESQAVHQYPRKVYEDWDFFRDRSPIDHAEGARTPLLILGGTDDTRVHPSQSLIMYRYYQKMADAPVRLIRYPGERHGNRKAAGRFDYNLRALRWMKRFLLEGAREMPAAEIDYESVLKTMKGEAPVGD